MPIEGEILNTSFPPFDKITDLYFVNLKVRVEI